MAKAVDWKELTNAQRFREILDDVQNNGDEHYILKDDKGQPQAALLSLEKLKLLETGRKSKEQAIKDLFKHLKPVHERNKHFSAEEVDRDVDEAIREMRQESA